MGTLVLALDWIVVVFTVYFFRRANFILPFLTQEKLLGYFFNNKKVSLKYFGFVVNIDITLKFLSPFVMFGGYGANKGS